MPLAFPPDYWQGASHAIMNRVVVVDLTCFTVHHTVVCLIVLFLYVGSRMAFATCAWLAVNTIQHTSCSASNCPTAGLQNTIFSEITKYPTVVTFPFYVFLCLLFLLLPLFCQHCCTCVVVQISLLSLFIHHSNGICLCSVGRQ